MNIKYINVKLLKTNKQKNLKYTLLNVFLKFHCVLMSQLKRKGLIFSLWITCHPDWSFVNKFPYFHGWDKAQQVGKLPDSKQSS